MTRIKICGITNLQDALAATDAGAHALGFVFAPSSPRCISPENAAEIIRQLPPFVQTVGVFVDAERSVVNDVIRECGIDTLQLHGQETPSETTGYPVRVVKGFRISGAADLESLSRYRVSAYLLDTYVPGLEGGTGKTFDWTLAGEARHFGRIILSGGLRDENVGEAIRTARPYAVDVSSGLENSPGKKSVEKMIRFVEAVRSADLEIQNKRGD
ncbi:MAG: phosphoribosylanthranilate isomerase [Bacteroidota bacterium]